MKDKGLWGCPLWIIVTYDGWRVGDVYTSVTEAEEAARKSILRLETIRIQ